MLKTFYLSRFSKCYFENPCFQLQQNVLWTDEMMCVINSTTGISKFGPMYLLNKHFIVFSKQTLVGNIKGKFKKIVP